MVLVSEPAAPGCNGGPVFAMLTCLVSPLSVLDPIQGPLLPPKMEGHTLLPAYLLTSNTQQTKQCQPSECLGPYRGLRMLISSPDGCGEMK